MILTVRTGRGVKIVSQLSNYEAFEAEGQWIEARRAGS
jgi:hypothetical protein